MALYINGERVNEGTGKVIYETVLPSGIGQFTICETEEELNKRVGKYNTLNLTNIESLFNAQPNSYIIGMPSYKGYAHPHQENVIYETNKPVPVYRLRWTDEAWEEYGKDEFNSNPREFEWSLPKILYYINEPETRSEDWTPYDETDWVEGLEWDNWYVPVSLEPVRYE